jgi:preprotein translocase subunit SecE
VARDRQRAKQRKQRRGEGTPPGGGERSIHRENVPGPVEHTGDVDEFEAALVSGADGEPVENGDEDEDRDLVRQALGESDGPAPVPAQPSSAEHDAARGSGLTRFGNFLRASWAELQRVQWPDRRQVGQATAVVLGFVVVAGAFLGLADLVAERLVDLII